MQLERFPDGEIRPSLGPVRGADVYVIRPTGPPVNGKLIELPLLLDAPDAVSREAAVGKELARIRERIAPFCQRAAVR